MKRFYITILTIFFLWNSAVSQSSLITISGIVLESGGTPAVYATIMAMNAKDSSLVKAGYSQEDGKFEIQGIEPGRYFLSTSYVGYSPFNSRVFELVNDQVFDIGEISLEATEQALEEVVVTAKKPIVEIKPGKTVFNVEKSINSSGSSALELLQKSPGVFVDNNDLISVAGRTGVNIYIDGKQTPLNGTDLAAYLKALQAEDISSIEIITNPSAKYDAEGNAGIIDIKLKKDKNLGANANINLGYQIGQLPKYEASARVNYRNRKINAYGNYSYNGGQSTNWMDINRRNTDNYFIIEGRMRNDYDNHNFRGGLDFFLDEQSTLGVLVHGYSQSNTFRNNSTNNIYLGDPDHLDNILIANNVREGERDNINYNINYAFTAKNGSTLNLDADYGTFKNLVETYQPNIYYDSTGQNIVDERIYQVNTPTDIDILTLKADYEMDLFNGKFGFGAKYANVNTNNILEFYDVIDDDYIFNEDRSNTFDYTENVNAAYINYSTQIKKWSLQLGMRVENTQSEGILTSNQPSEDDDVKRSYTDLFPSGGVTYQLNKKNSLRLNYSRRIDRPNYQDLNPFEFQLDELTFRKGNAFLNPQYTNSIELTHTFNYSLNTTLSYTHTTDYITNITDTLNQTASFITLKNLATQKVLSLNISYPFSVTKWWSVFTNFTAFHLENKGEFEGSKVVDITANTVNIYAQNTINLPKSWNLEISGWYQSPSVWGGNFKTDALWNLDIGVQRKLFNGRANLKVSVSDIFLSTNWHGQNDFGALQIDARGGRESRRFRVNFSYLLGNDQVKASRKRKAGLEEENSRIKTED